MFVLRYWRFAGGVSLLLRFLPGRHALRTPNIRVFGRRGAWGRKPRRFGEIYGIMYFRRRALLHIHITACEGTIAIPLWRFDRRVEDAGHGLHAILVAYALVGERDAGFAGSCQRDAPESSECYMRLPSDLANIKVLVLCRAAHSPGCVPPRRVFLPFQRHARRRPILLIGVHFIGVPAQSECDVQEAAMACATAVRGGKGDGGCRKRCSPKALFTNKRGPFRAARGDADKADKADLV